MANDVVICAEGLGKKYAIGHQAQRERYVSLREVLGRGAKNLRRKAGDLIRGRAILSGDTIEEFWALKDISFNVTRGEVLGIIGRNGAGKSTLLKVLSRITEPSAGRVAIRGRIASLLEVGTGFHPELTGRENIYLNGAILSMSRAEIRRKFDEIVDFAGVEKFLDTPVKRYSSGMYVRLAFAVAAHLEPEILVVDEVLAVGDAEFQQRCLGKMSEVASNGRTVLFVSHNMLAINALCSRGIVLDAGKKIIDDSPAGAVAAYIRQTAAKSGAAWERSSSKVAEVYFSHLSIAITGEQPQLKLICQMKVVSSANGPASFVAIDIKDQRQIVIMQAIPSHTPFLAERPGIQEIAIEIDLPPLVPGRYTVDAWVGPNYNVTHDYVLNALAFEVIEAPIAGRTYPYLADHGAIAPVARLV